MYQKNNPHEKTKSTPLHCLLALCTALLAVIAARFINKQAAITAFLAGSGGIIGLFISILIRQKSEIGKAVDDMDSKLQRKLTVYYLLGALLAMVSIVLLVLCWR